MTSTPSANAGLIWAIAELLREQRAALVAAAVTGQIDVRGWAGASRM